MFGLVITSTYILRKKYTNVNYMNGHDQHLYKLHTSNNNANTVVTCLKILKI